MSRFRRAITMVAVLCSACEQASSAQVSVTGEALQLAEADADGGSAEPVERFVHQPDLMSLVARVVTADGLLDPEFVETVSQPSIYYTDFYGIQALATISRDDLLQDLVPDFAELAGSDEHSVTLRFDGEWSATFYPFSALQVNESVVPFDHVYVDGSDWRAFTQHLDRLRSILRSEGLQQKYLVPNYYYGMELNVNALRQLATTTELTPDPDYALFADTPDAALIFPDPVHGDEATYARLVALLDSAQYDWLALEMLPAQKQQAADLFVSAPDGSSELVAAEQELSDYFRSNWNRFGDEAGDPERNRYFQLMRRMRAQGKRVIGMDGISLEYTVFRYGETEFGGGVRSLSWARTIPRSGKGIVFGGSAHFSGASAINFQDFCRTFQPARPLLIAANPPGVP